MSSNGLILQSLPNTDAAESSTLDCKESPKSLVEEELVGLKDKVKVSNGYVEVNHDSSTTTSVSSIDSEATEVGTTTYEPDEYSSFISGTERSSIVSEQEELSQSISPSILDFTNAVLYFFETNGTDNGHDINKWVGGSIPNSQDGNNDKHVKEQNHLEEPCSSSNIYPMVPINNTKSSAAVNEEQRSSNFLRPNDLVKVSEPLLRSNQDVDQVPCSLYPNMDDNRSHSSIRLDQRKYTIVPMRPVVYKNDPKLSKRQGNEALGLVLSALYGKLLVVMGIAFPMSEVISTFIPPSFYDGFYLYLYFGSITFMICIYGNVLRQKATRSMRSTLQRINTMRNRFKSHSGVAPENTGADRGDSEDSCSDGLPANSRITKLNGPQPIAITNTDNNDDTGSGTESDYSVQRIHFGSFYLRMGSIAFGIGSMIYSGLEFGQYFELEPDTKCNSFMIALTPSVRTIFIFAQMYFIFLNSKLAVSSVRLGAQFGLMHMIGCNLCVWLNVLVTETKHEILHFYNPENNTFYVNYNRHVPPKIPNPATHSPFNKTEYANLNSMGALSNGTSVFGNLTGAVEKIMTTAAGAILSEDSTVHHRVKRGLRGPHSMYECRRTDIMGSLVQNTAPFLFPCTIEYSLICAAILYVMWRNVMHRSMNPEQGDMRLSHSSNAGNQYYGTKRSPHHYSVDCARANKGLFLGIFILVMTIISLILFFVLINRPGYQALAIMEVNITELVLYTTATIAVLIGMCQVRELRYDNSRNLELDNILLLVAQTGSFIYNVFSIIGGHFTLKKNTILVMMSALVSLIQLLLQTIFILDASKRCAANADQARRKPGREVVTFLLVTNLAMWLINTLEKSRADSHPVQLKFYGIWFWVIITHISMPLAIFYRFHSTVILVEIWKKAFKLKQTYS